MTDLTSAQLDCPVCGEPLPPIEVSVGSWKINRKRELEIKLRPDLHSGWWYSLGRDHPSCIGREP